MTIYQICSQSRVYETFNSLHAAQVKLWEYDNERRNKMGVHDFQMSETGNSFSFLLIILLFSSVQHLLALKTEKLLPTKS